MKICCIWRDTGGGNRISFNVFSQIARSGVEVHVITSVPPLPGSTAMNQLIMHRIGGKPDSDRLRLTSDLRFFVTVTRRFFQLHRQIGFDVIHMSSTNFPAVGLFLSLLSKVSGCRSTMGFSSIPLRKEELKALPSLIKEFPLWWRVFYPLALSLPGKLWSWGLDAVIVPSQIGASLLKQIGVNENKVHFIPPGVDFNVFKPQPKFGRPPYRIVYASSCYPWKGTLDLLEAFGIAVRRGFALELVYVFYTPRTQSPATRFSISQLERKIAELGLSRKVEIHDGPMEGIEQAIAQADIVACPIQVGVGTLDIPMSVLEGMACGLPVLATRVGGIPEAVIDGVNGYLVEPAAPDKLAEALVKIIEDPARMGKMGEESLRLAQRFDVKKCAALLLETYSALAGQRS
jgi:glycosyltransferase involved in cell wall biosynthesis